MGGNRDLEVCLPSDLLKRRGKKARANKEGEGGLGRAYHTRRRGEGAMRVRLQTGVDTDCQCVRRMVDGSKWQMSFNIPARLP